MFSGFLNVSILDTVHISISTLSLLNVGRIHVELSLTVRVVF